jgi:hypothetical protein
MLSPRMWTQHSPQFGCVARQEVTSDPHSSGPGAFRGLPSRQMRRPHSCEWPAALGDRERAAALSDVIEKREALGLELGYAHDPMFHESTVT